jgi:hypothetical protein
MRYEEIEEGRIYKLDGLYYKALREQKTWKAWLFKQLNSDFTSWCVYESSTYRDMELAEEIAQILYGKNN